MIRQIGVHRIQHGDIMRGIDALMGGAKADLMYTDPPWGDGAIKMWATLNRKNTGQEFAPAALDDFLGAVFDVARRHVHGFLLVEYGVRWAEGIQRRGVAAGFMRGGLVTTYYRSGGKLMPMHLHLFSTPGFAFPQDYAGDVQGTYGYATLQAAVPPLARLLKARKPDPVIMLDPLCGMGYSAQAAIDNGLAFRGNEFNAVRLAKTIKRLEGAAIPA